MEFERHDHGLDQDDSPEPTDAEVEAALGAGIEEAGDGPAFLERLVYRILLEETSEADPVCRASLKRLRLFLGLHPADIAVIIERLRADGLVHSVPEGLWMSMEEPFGP